MAMMIIATMTDMTKMINMAQRGTRIGAREANAIRPLATRRQVRSAGHRAARPTLLVPVLALLAQRDTNESRAEHAPQSDLGPLCNH